MKNPWLAALLLALVALGGMAQKAHGVENAAPADILDADEGSCHVSDPSRYRAPFSFDEVRLEPLTARAKLDGRLQGFYKREARIEITSFSFPLLLQLPTRILGACDWWPDKLAIPWHAGNQVFFDEDSDGSTARSVLWSAGFGVRWYFNPGLFTEAGYGHTSFGGVSNEDAEAFVARNNINVDELKVRDIVFLRVAHQFNPIPRLTAEYRIDWNMWEANVGDVFSSFFSSDKRRPYHSFLGWIKMHYRVTPVSDIAFGGAFERRNGKTPLMLEASYDMFLSLQREYALSVFFRVHEGAEDHALSTGAMGEEISRTVYGIAYTQKVN